MALKDRMTNAFTIDKTRPSLARALDKANTHSRAMSRWVEKQRDKGKEPMRLQLPGTPNLVRRTK